jgi:chromosome segregation ATPase
VGLSLAIQPERALDLTHEADDGAPEARALPANEALALEAARRLRLCIAGVGEITAAAGHPKDRQEATQLRTRWEKKGAPVLAAAKVRSLGDLVRAVELAEQRQRELAELRRSSNDKRQQAAELRRSLGSLAELKARVAEREAALRDGDRVALEEQLRAIGDRLDLELEEARQTLASAEKTAGQHEVQLASLGTTLQADRATLAQRRSELAARRAALGADPGVQLEEGDRRVEELQAARRQSQQRVAELTTDVDAAAGKARDEVERISSLAETARRETEQKAARVQELESGLAGERARLEERRKQTDPAGRQTCRQRVAELEAKLAELAGGIVSETEIAVLRDEHETLQKEAASAESALLKATGGLQTVGGVVVKEQEKECEDALEIAERRQKDLELDYDAWQLLVDTLKQAERDEASHLGRAVVEPVSQRFKALTGGRYGKLEMGPSLETQGITAAGKRRDVSALSVGTKEQLATILRLSLADSLKTCLILDDQLAQSDDERLRWVRNVLCDCASRFQIIVLTCRPEAYLEEVEGKVSEVDLTSVIRRFGLPGTSQ